MTAPAVGPPTSLDTGQQSYIGDRLWPELSPLERTSPGDTTCRRGPRLTYRKVCGWCSSPFDASRSDRVFCLKSCRQAAHRAKVGEAVASSSSRPLRLAYADPPYPGLSRKCYADHPDYAGEVDHAELLSRLATYDGWALSTSEAALPDVLALAVASGSKPRVASWIRGARPHPTARVLHGWEPVLYVPARSTPDGSQAVDYLVGPTPRRRSTLPSAVVGAKPPEFCRWVFTLLGADPRDSFDDLFPGSGIVARSWEWFAGYDPSRAAGATRLLPW